MTNDETMRPRRPHPDELAGPHEDYAGDVPADDEFYDDGAYVEGEEGVTDDWHEDGEATEGEPGEAAPAKKKSNFNTIVIALAVVLGLFFLYSALGHRSTTNVTSNNLRNAGQLPGTGPAAATSPFPATNGGNPNGGLLNDQTALNNLPGKIDNANTAASTNNAAAEAPLTPVPAIGGQPAAGLQPMQANSPFMKAQDQAQAQNPSATQTPAAPAAAPAATVQAPAQTQTTVTQTTASDPRIDELTRRLATDEQRLNAMPGKAAPAGNTDAKAVSQLNARLDRLEQMQTQLAAQLQSIAQNAPSQAAQPSARADNQDQAQAGNGAITPMPSTMATATVPAHAAHRAKPARRAAPARPAAASGSESSAATWTLKSAQPGEAYVSAPNSDSMIAVHPGDNFPGLGKVESIGQVNGQWVVRGSQGSITQ